MHFDVRLDRTTIRIVLFKNKRDKLKKFHNLLSQQIISILESYADH